MTGDLFEDLREEMGCMHISDIRVGRNRQWAIRIALSFSYEDYEEKQWNDLANYLGQYRTEGQSKGSRAVIESRKKESRNMKKKGTLMLAVLLAVTLLLGC